jgi:hypothetical protein
MSLKQVHLFVRGRVQGVYFRAAAQREARRLGERGGVHGPVGPGEEEEIKEYRLGQPGSEQPGSTTSMSDGAVSRDYPDFASRTDH